MDTNPTFYVVMTSETWSMAIDSDFDSDIQACYCCWHKRHICCLNETVHFL